MTGERFLANRFLVIAVCLGALAAAFAYSPYVFDGPVVCPLHGISGLPCPGCGLTRAFCALAKGDVAGALAFNAFSIPLALLFIVAPLIAAGEIIARRRFAFYDFMYSWKLGCVMCGAVAAYHMCRIVFWIAQGTFWNDWITTSWTYRLIAG